MDTTNLNLSTLAKATSNEHAAWQFMEQVRWPDGPVCPHCGADRDFTFAPEPTAELEGWGEADDHGYQAYLEREGLVRRPEKPARRWFRL